MLYDKHEKDIKRGRFFLAIWNDKSDANSYNIVLFPNSKEMPLMSDAHNLGEIQRKQDLFKNWPKIMKHPFPFLIHRALCVISGTAPFLRIMVKLILYFYTP